MRAAAEGLKYRDFITVGLILNRREDFPDNWVYIHDPQVQVGRMQNFKNWSPDMVADPGTTCLGLEYFCFEGDGLWDADDEALMRLASAELQRLRICTPDEILDGVVIRQPKAYPVYDDEYKAILDVLREYVEAHLRNLQLVGRNDMYHYNNQDHSMMTALLAARNIATGARLDPWKVNTDAEYREETTHESEDHSGRWVPQRVGSS